jgi:CHAT domain-containing protein
MEHTELAVLLACETVKGDNALPDETMHLAAVMLAVGCRGVIGIMWSVSDEYASIITSYFYIKLRELRRNGWENKKATAYALHDAISRFRALGIAPWVLNWALFVHFTS